MLYIRLKTDNSVSIENTDNFDTLLKTEFDFANELHLQLDGSYLTLLYEDGLKEDLPVNKAINKLLNHVSPIFTGDVLFTAGDAFVEDYISLTADQSIKLKSYLDNEINIR